MNRARIVEGLDLAALNGIEFGPLDRPVVRRADGPVTYVDHLTTEDLRRKYADEPGVDVEAFEAIDAVWGARTLKEALPHGVRFDYAVASHVMEHVPDLLGWLGELRQVLTDAGELRLVLPDRRFTFDYLRAESTAADMMDSHLRGQRVPSPRAVFDHFLNHREVDSAAAWAGPLHLDPLPTWERFQVATSAARGSLQGRYTDTHCWVFTPASFAGLLEFACHFELAAFACERLYETEQGQLEFFAHLRVCRSPSQAAASWRDAAAALARPDDPRLSAAREALKAAEAEIAALRGSTSWRVTAPLRRVGSIFRR